MKHPAKIAVVAAILLLLTGCGGNGDASDASAADPSKDNPVTVKYGSFSTGTAARQVLVAQDKGFFEEEGINLEITTLMSTSALGSLLASGEVDIANLTYQPAFDALAAGIDIKMLSAVQAIQPGMQTVYAREDSGFQSLKDLKGKKFAVSSLGGYGEMLLAESLKEQGMSIDDVTMVEVSPPETIGALERGDIDAAHLASPFRAAVKTNPQSPLTEIYDFYDTKVVQGLGQSALVANGGWLEENKGTADAFMRAVNKAAEFLDSNEDEDRAYLEKLGKFKPEQVKEIPLEKWVGDTTGKSDLQHILDLMDANGQIDKNSVDLDSFTTYLGK